MNRPLTCAIVVPAEIGVLDQRTLFAEGGKLRRGDEEVSDAVEFARSGFSRRMGYSESECAGVVIKQLLNKRSFADARGAGDDDGSAILRRWEVLIGFPLNSGYLGQLSATYTIPS